MTFLAAENTNTSSHRANQSATSSNATHGANCSAFSFQTISDPINAVPLITWSIAVLCQLFDLTGFYLWRNKQPFMRFHVALAITSLLGGLLGVLAPLLRASPWTAATVLIAKLDVAAFGLVNCAAIVNTLFISIDRWLSVEFPHYYRNNISNRKVIIALLASWLISILIFLPGIIVFRNFIDVSCDGPFTLKINGTFGDPAQSVFAGLTRGFFLLPILFIFQVWILVIAVETKLRRVIARRQIVNPRRRSEASPPEIPRIQQAYMTMRIVWGTLLGSMAVVIGTVLANVPYSLLPIPGLKSKNLLALIKLQNSLFTVSYLYTPLVYLIFFPQFRGAITGALEKGRVWVRVHFPLVTGTSRAKNGPAKTHQLDTLAAPAIAGTAATLQKVDELPVLSDASCSNPRPTLPPTSEPAVTKF